MFQCLGLGTAESNGCGEDWWHPGCVVGLGPDWFETKSDTGFSNKAKADKTLATIAEVAEGDGDTSTANAMEKATNGADKNTESTQPNNENGDEEDDDDDLPLPPGFPAEDDFDAFICYKCLDANPWIKKYAGSPGFLAPVFRRSLAPSPEAGIAEKTSELVSANSNGNKRKAEDSDLDASGPIKRMKDETTANTDSSSAEPLLESNSTGSSTVETKPCKAKALSPAPVGQFSLFLKSDFRDHLCRCPDCFPELAKHPQLLEEEENYEPPLSESGDDAGGSTVGSGSIYDRGESALKNIDRVRAIEGVMAYNHLKDKLKPFFQQFAESGQAISAEDIKAHFAKLRGDDEAIKQAGEGVKNADNGKEQGGY